MAQIREIVFNGEKMEICQAVSGRNKTSTKLVYLKSKTYSVRKNVVVRPRIKYHSCMNVTFKTLVPAYQAMLPDEKQEFFKNLAPKFKNYLAVRYCKDCGDALRKGEKISKQCRHTRVWPNTPVCVLQTLNKLANLARKRDYNRLHKTILPLENKFKNRCYKIYIKELLKSPSEKVSFGDFKNFDDELEAIELQEYLEFLKIKNFKKQQKLMQQRQAEEACLLNLNCWKAPPPVEEKYNPLSATIRLIVEQFVAKRSGVDMTDRRIAMLKMRSLMYIPTSKFQMQNEETIAELSNPIEKHEGNVNIQLAEENVVPSIPKIDNLSLYTHVESNNEFESFTSRLTHLGDFTWSSNGIKTKFGDSPNIIENNDIELSIFGDIYERLKNLNSPLIAPFKHFRFGKFDLEFVIKISSTILQAGTLLIAPTYFAEKLESTALLEPESSKNYPLVNPAILSQRPHALLKAHDVTEVTVRIPFKHWQTMMSLSSVSTSYGYWEYAKLNIVVLNKLMVAGSTCATGNLSGQIYVRLVNSQFSGMIPKASNQMMSTAALLLASRYLADPNNDLPGNYANPSRLQPSLSQSFSFGTNAVDNRDVLRLDPTGNTPHPEQPEDFSELKIMQTPGLLNVVDWKQSDAEGKILFSVECTPLLEKSKYINFISDKQNNESAYVIPPVAVWASDKMAFTGGLIFTLDICTTKFSAGMLEVIYIPGEMPTNIADIDVSGYMHAVLDIKETKVYHIATPSIINQPAWYRRYLGLQLGENYVSPGQIVIRIRQALAGTCEIVPPDVKINIFVRADDNLRCHVLTAPVMVPQYYQTKGITYVATLNHPDAGIGTWAQATTTVEWAAYKGPLFAPTLRYNPVTGGVNTAIVKFPLKEGLYSMSEQMTFHGRSGEFQTEFVLVLQTTYDDYWYIFPIPMPNLSLEDFVIIRAAFENNGKPTMSDVTYRLASLSFKKYNMSYLRTANDYDVIAYHKGILLAPVDLWNNIKPTLTTRQLLSSNSSFDNLLDANLQNDIVRMVPAVPASNASIFGEKPVNIKDACRRKQFLKLIDIHGSQTSLIADEFLPVCVNYLNSDVGLKSQIKCNNYNLYGSGYLGFRGSLVYTIIPLRRANGLLGVQHVPDIKNITDKHRNAVNTGLVPPDVLLQPGYAQQWVDMQLNSNLTIEIPYYRNSRWLFAPKTKNLIDIESIAQCNGGLKIFSTASETVTCAVWVSFGDDASFTYFQGFPPMKFLSDDLTQITPIKVTNQILDKMQNAVNSHLDDVTANITPVLNNVNVVTSDIQAVVEPLKTGVPEIINDSKEAVNGVRRVTDKIEKALDFVPTAVTDFLEKSREKAVEIFDILCNFAHVLVDLKNWKHWAIFLSSILIRWGVTAKDKMLQLIEALTTLIKSKFNKTETKTLDEIKEPQPSTSTSSTNPSVDDCVEIPKATFQSGVDWLAVGALIVSGIGARSEVKSKNWYAGNISKLALITKSTAVGFKWVKELFQCIYEFIEASIVSLMLSMCPHKSILKADELQKYMVFEWYEVAIKYINPYYFDQIKNSKVYVAEVNKLIAYGQQLVAMLNILNIDPKVNVIVNSTVTSLSKIREKLRAEYIYGPAMEPFCVWVEGPAGVGKTYVQEHFFVNLLHSQSIELYGREMVFTVPAKAEFWERVENQPICVYDDFLVYKDDQTSRDVFATFLALVNKAPFSPPIAACEEKKKLYNPDVVWVNANWATSECAALSDKAAFHRRRHVVLRAKLHPDFADLSRLIQHDSYFSKYKTHVFTRYAEIPPEAYMGMVQLIYGSKVEANGSYNVPPSPHLLFDVLTCRGESDYDLVASDLDSLQTAKLLNMKFSDHRKNMFALLERSSNIASNLNNMQGEQIVFKAKTDDNGVATNSNIIMDNLGKLCLTEVQVVGNAETTIQSNIMKHALPVSKSGLPLFKGCDLTDKKNIRSAAEFMTQARTANKTDYITLKHDEEDDPTVINIRDKLIKSYFQMDAPSTSKQSNTDFKWFITMERAPNSLQDELYVTNSKTKKKAQIKAYNHVMKFSGYDDIHYNQIASIFSEFKVLNVTYQSEGKLEDILYKRWKTLKAKLEVIFKYHMKLHDMDMEREKEIDPYVAQLLQAMDEENEDISDVLDLMELIQRNKLPEFYRSQLSTCCHHRFFSDKAYYVNGYFIMKLKSNIVVLSDKPCINQVRCPWRNKTVYGNMMVNWSVKNIQVTEKVMSSNLTPEDLITVPEYFKEIYKRNKKNFDIMQEAKKSWTGKIKKFIMKDVPDFLYNIYKFVKEYYPIVLAFICAFSLTTSAIYVAKTTEGQGEFFELVNEIGKKYSLMTPKQKLEYDVYRQQCQTGEVMENPSLCRTYISLLKRLDKNIDSSNSLQIINSGSQPSIRSRITNRHSSLLKQSKNQNLNIPAIEGIKNKIVRNTFWIIACDKSLPLNETAGMEMRCLGVAERWAIMPTHYLQWWEDADHSQLELRIFYKDVFMKLPNDWIIVKDIPQSGLVLFEVPRGIPHWQNILKYLPYDLDDFDKLNMSSVTLLETKINDVVIERSSPAQITMVSASGSTQSQVDVVVQAAFEYTIHTQPGTCGSVLMCGEKIVGMHIAGHMKPRPTGYSSALIGNEIYEILNWPRKKKIFEYHDLEGDEALGDWKDSKMLPNSGIIPLGVIKRKDLTIFIPNKSQWQQSLMFGTFPSRKSPAVLSYTDPRIQGAFSPLQEAINKHGLVPKPLPYQSFHIARLYWINKHINIMMPIFRQPSVLSLEQAICGIPGLNYYDKIEFNSSEGWPFSKIRPPGCSGKKWLFKTEVVDGNLKLKSIFPLLKEQITNHILDTKENILSFSVVVDLLKDELKPNEKVLKPGKTRCFSGAPVDEVIRFKMFFQDYIAYYMHYRFQNSSAIGMSCVGTEPTILVNYMLSKNFSKHCCGDYTDFGPAFEANCGSVFYESAVRWYDFYSQSEKLAEEQLARKCMSEGFINPKHLVLDSVYQTICGMASGCPATAPCNTDVNKMYIAIAWLEITKCDLLTFEENVKLVCYGDDIWFSISDEFAEVFNNETLHIFFKQYDIKYTDNTKSDTINKYSTFEEVEFLKRKFIPHPTRKGQYLAALDKVSIEECCNWIQSDPSDLELTKQICESAMELAYSHGPDYYNMVQTKIMHRWSTIIGAPPLKTRSWIELDKIFYKEMKGVVHTFDSDWYLPEGTTE